MSCLLCTDGCKWCQPPPSSWPSWFKPSKHALAHQERVRKGLHPLGFMLSDLKETCGTCANRYVVRMSGSYHNCRKVRHTGGPGTDVRMKWQACEHWEKTDG